MNRISTICVVGLLAAAGAVHATEGGGSSYAHGTENFMVGAVPPQGLYGMVFATHYSADRMNDANGNSLGIPGFKVTANAVVPRLVWVPGVKLLGGDLVTHAVAPLVNLTVSAMGASQSKSGLGDVTAGAGIGFHHSPKLHSALAVDLVLPTGRYDKNDMANIGRNHLTVEPVYALTYVDPQGFNGDLRIGYLLNQRNKDTDYTSGNEFHFDYAAGWGLGNGWTIGIGGYVRQQVGLDKQAGVKLANSKTSGIAIGPNIKYDSGKGWFVTAKWQFESKVKNGTEGNALWLKAVFPL
ncbi:MAG: transporter [Hydrogenophaga sp.]|nr:transporter [Hydrogenophaga sp.]